MSVRVVARIRPLLETELDKDIIVRPDGAEAGGPHTVVKIPNPKNQAEDFSFAFNAVYDQSTSQETLFTSEVQPHLKSLFQGYDVTIFAYGVTGTGKTHTMRGGLKLADRGVIPRLLSGVFRRGKKIAKDSDGNTTVKVSLSYYEIYNDKVFDLLEPPEQRTPSGLPLRAEVSGRTVVAGLSERACEDLRDFEKLYIEANNNRVTASTKLNAHSSRSHAILRVKVTQTTDGMIRESTVSAIDLAGSEDNRRTDNGKERLVESAAINKSLFVLSQCIDAISRGDKRIPYRESKMTRILSLGQNNGITLMFLNLAPLRSYHLDTLSSLNVSSRAKRIEVREIENEVVFKQFPRTTGSNAAQRQPLRPLAHALSAHNVHNGNVAAKASADAIRPTKSFSVYTDKAKQSPARTIATSTLLPRPAVNVSLVPRRSTVHKRPSDHESGIARPSKVARRSIDEPAITVTASQIEAMVEKKVGEILAARTAAEKAVQDQKRTPSRRDVSEAMQRRLEALERRMESDNARVDSKSDGLRFLLAARQHREKGDDASALRAYEMALPFFPGQAKLIGKIQRLRNRLGVSVEQTCVMGSPLRHDRGSRRPRLTIHADGTSSEQDDADVEEETLDDQTMRIKPRKLRSKSTAKLHVYDDANETTARLGARDLAPPVGLVSY
ncbi:kinesin [Metarhizium album ARSEF 1941]|uniref:Kinesin n=1 Tax=Metarhizium album (strain ARSEF 1941) TaxID=1081103 RepID=A0A0B2X6W3_METAS|nr:kinesin [Metarhizium album ARSEF 1941]KHO01036.1 kinesin [Metarhizium album ARSEF 1941]